MPGSDRASFVNLYKACRNNMKNAADELSLRPFMSRCYTISPDPFLVVIKDEEGNTYSCNHMDMVELDGYSVYVPGIYDWYLYFNTFAEWTKHCMDKRFKAKMFHRRGKALAKVLRAQMHPEDILFYYRSVDDDSGVVLKRSRVKLSEDQSKPTEELQLTLPFYTA